MAIVITKTKGGQVDKEICNECGRSVKQGSGRFVNRVCDFNEEEDRREMGKPYPQGDFICDDCNLELPCDFFYTKAK
mgnify:CR=1 FL=1